MASTFLSAEWRKLAMANYAVDPKILEKYLPYKTELDLWNGNFYVSLVGFMFVNTRVKGFRIPFHTDFEEVNLRFYVKHFDGKDWKRGVVFIKEIVPRAAITLVANTLYNEKYQTLAMAHHWGTTVDSHHVEYKWKHKDWHSFKVVTENTATEIAVGSKEEFITEHYWGYTKMNGNNTSEYGVEHPRWQVYKVKEHAIKVDFGLLYGQDFAFLNNEQPLSVFLAEGSEIVVKQGLKIK